MAKRRIGPLIPNQDGTYTAIFDDGSFARFNSSGMIVEQDDSPNPQRAALMGAGNDEAAAATVDRASGEDARRFNEGMQRQKEQIDNSYKVSMLNARTQQEQVQITREYQQAQVELAKQRLQFEKETSTREFGQRQSEFNTNTGLSMLQTSASLRGPDNYFQSAEYARGVAGNPNTSTFLSALQNNTQLAGYGAQAGQPDPVTVGSLVGKLQGGGASNDNNYLAQIGNIGAKGAHQLGAGSLENLTETEGKLLVSGLDELGYDSSTFLDQYKRSRIGQGIGTGRAA